MALVSTSSCPDNRPRFFFATIAAHPQTSRNGRKAMRDLNLLPLFADASVCVHYLVCCTFGFRISVIINICFFFCIWRSGSFQPQANASFIYFHIYFTETRDVLIATTIEYTHTLDLFALTHRERSIKIPFFSNQKCICVSELVMRLLKSWAQVHGESASQTPLDVSSVCVCDARSIAERSIDHNRRRLHFSYVFRLQFTHERDNLHGVDHHISRFVCWDENWFKRK